MNVIPFPNARVTPIATEVARQDIALALVASLRASGEPSTVRELGEVMADLAMIPSNGDVTDLEGVLLAYGEDGDLQLLGRPVFRAVALRGETAWAFTVGFRVAMRQLGLKPRMKRSC